MSPLTITLLVAIVVLLGIIGFQWLRRNSRHPYLEFIVTEWYSYYFSLALDEFSKLRRAEIASQDWEIAQARLFMLCHSQGDMTLVMYLLNELHEKIIKEEERTGIGLVINDQKALWQMVSKPSSQT